MSTSRQTASSFNRSRGFGGSRSIASLQSQGSEASRCAPQPWERLKLLAVCREVDKESGRVSVYPLNLEITSEIITSLKMRAQFNPELRYFTTTTARWDRYGEVMAGILKRRTVSRADLDNIGGICEI